MPVNPWRDLRAWQERLERLSVPHAESWTPAVDIYETPERYVVSAELPGLRREEINLVMSDSRLTIRGERVESRPGDGGYQQVERGHGPFSRTFEFADPIADDGVSAEFTDGILTIVLPKRPPEPGRTIDVR
jgi:HSP20 family protein